MDKKTQRRLNSSSLVLVLVAFIAAVIVSNKLFQGWRVDLTENSLYTLSDGTKNILGSIDEPINLYFYYSDKATANVPILRDYANRVREMLEEMEAAADGNINLSVIDPLPFSEDEDRAAQFGLQAVALPGAQDPVYLGLAGTDSLDNSATLPFFQPDKEAFLEYDIAKLISTLAEPERTVIGLITSVEMSGSFDPQTQQMTPAWMVHQQAGQLFEVRDLGADPESIDEEITMLWIVQPRGLTNRGQYAVDQFLMRGGTALIFVDPLAETDPAPPMQGMPQGMPPMGQSSDLPALFEAWGVNYSANDVIADAQLALQLSSPGGMPVRHFGYLGLTTEQINQDDIVSADLSTLNIATAGFLSLTEDSVLQLEPLLTSSSVSESMPSSRFSFLPDPSTLQDGFTPGGSEYVIAARLTGNLTTAFPNGKPADTVDSGDGDVTPDMTDHLSEATAPANLVVVADVDLLSDMMWVQVQNFFGQQIANPFASNGAFVANALESLSGSSDLISVRSRASFSRPFTRVEALRVEAESKYRETEEGLQAELDETEARLGELQASREDTGNFLLTQEQQDEIDRFIDRRSEIRQELRAVQRNLDKDIESLGTRLKVINIGLVPLLLTLLVLFSVWRRSRGTSE